MADSWNELGDRSSLLSALLLVFCNIDYQKNSWFFLTSWLSTAIIKLIQV